MSESESESQTPEESHLKAIQSVLHKHGIPSDNTRLENIPYDLHEALQKRKEQADANRKAMGLALECLTKNHDASHAAALLAHALTSEKT